MHARRISPFWILDYSFPFGIWPDSSTVKLLIFLKNKILDEKGWYFFLVFARRIILFLVAPWKLDTLYIHTREEKRSAPLCPISLSGVIIAESADPVDLWADIHLTLTAAGIINWWKLKLYPI